MRSELEPRNVKCETITTVGTNAQCVQTQCMYATQSSRSTSSLVFCFVVCLLVYASFKFYL